MLIRASNITKSFLDDVVLDNVSLELGAGDRVGLLGINGAGKTTLLNILEGTLQPDEGAVVRAGGLQVGYLKQNDALDSAKTLEEEIQAAFARVHGVEAQMKDCAARLQKAPEDAGLLEEYDRLQAQFEMLDGYSTEAVAARVLNGLGFGGFNRDTPVNTLSGGEKMRFAFAKMLLSAPDLLMLDEPTNHLDFSMLAWLEEYLAGYKGAVLVVSHDRYFLDAIAKDICELERHRLTLYHGGYTSFVAQKAERRKVAQRAYEKQQEEIEKMEDYVRRNLVRASTSNMAKSRRKTLEKMDRLEKPQGEGKSIALKFDYDVEPYQSVLLCEGLGVRVGQGGDARQLYTGLELEVLRGEKIALVGLNGVGKSTFLKAIQNLMPHDGLVRWGGNVRLGYFDQELAGLPMEATVLEAVHSQYPQKTEYEIRSALGRLLLEGEAVFKRVRELSGAQRAKVAFAILQMRRANVLLLDEPTNHLDYSAKEVLEETLLSFSGTLLVVSHDRYFLRRVPTAILEMRPEGFVRTDGNFDDYLNHRRAVPVTAGPPKAPPAEAEVVEAAAAPPLKSEGKRSKQQRAADAQRRSRIATLDREMDELEAALAETNAALASPQNASDFELLAKLSETLEQQQETLDAAMEEWLALTE